MYNNQIIIICNILTQIHFAVWLVPRLCHFVDSVQLKTRSLKVTELDSFCTRQIVFPCPFAPRPPAAPSTRQMSEQTAWGRNRRNYYCEYFANTNVIGKTRF